MTIRTIGVCIFLFWGTTTWGTNIDSLVNKKLLEMNIKANPMCSDEDFIRRAYLLVTGRIPHPDTVSSFISNHSLIKRTVLINRLLESDDYIDYQVLKWGDLLKIKSEFPSNLWPNAVQAYNRWLKESLRSNKPYNQFVRDLLVSSGSNFRSPEVNFYRAFQNRTPQNIASNVFLLFLGERLKDSLLIKDMGIFFSQLKYKKTNEWKEEIVYNDNEAIINKDNVKMPDGSYIKLPSLADLRNEFANWLISPKNKRFAGVIVNRIWFWLMGEGIVNPPDDFSSTNLPINTELLSYLGDELIQRNYDLKHIFRLILNSETFQRQATGDAQKVKYFAGYKVQRLTAGQIVDAIGDITENRDSYMSKVPEPFTFLPPNTCASQIGDGSITSPVLELFGCPSRDASFESDRNSSLTAKQVLYLLNSSQIIEKINNSKRLRSIVEQIKQKEKLIEQIYLLVLSRYPTNYEIQLIIDYAKNNQLSVKQGCADLVWALINTKEFLFLH